MKINMHTLKLRDRREEKLELKRMKCGTENVKKLIRTQGVGSVLKCGNLLKELEHQEKKCTLTSDTNRQMGAILPGPSTENRPEYEGNKNISPTQMDGETVEVSEERVRKAVREIKMGNDVDQKEYTRRC